MLKVAVTGNIGSGKSTIVNVFKHLGIPVYKADDRAKSFYENQEIILQLVRHFGNEITNIEGKIDFKKLGNIVFTDENELKWLNAFIHPLVKSDFENWVLQNLDKPYIIQEAAILFESGFDRYFDQIITVSTDFEERIQRVMLRDSVSRELVLNRIKNQISDEEKEKRSNFVIHNGDKDLVLPQIISIHQQLIALNQN